MRRWKRKWVWARSEYCVSGSFITLRDGLVGNFLANANSDMHFYFTDIQFLFAALTVCLYLTISRCAIFSPCLSLSVCCFPVNAKNEILLVMFPYLSFFVRSSFILFLSHLRACVRFFPHISYSYHQKYPKSGTYNTSQLTNTFTHALKYTYTTCNSNWMEAELTKITKMNAYAWDIRNKKNGSRISTNLNRKTLAAYVNMWVYVCLLSPFPLPIPSRPILSTHLNHFPPFFLCSFQTFFNI